MRVFIKVIKPHPEGIVFFARIQFRLGGVAHQKEFPNARSCNQQKHRGAQRGKNREVGDDTGGIGAEAHDDFIECLAVGITPVQRKPTAAFEFFPAFHAFHVFIIGRHSLAEGEDAVADRRRLGDAGHFAL